MATYSQPPRLNPAKGTSQQAWVYVLTNQLVAPGLGSIMAGRKWLGGIQLLLAVAGFIVVMSWFVQLYSTLFTLMDRWDPEWKIDWTLLQVGLTVFLLAWLLALHTSWQLLRHEKSSPKN